MRLEAVKLGRTLVTSREALQRFAERLTSQAAPVVSVSSSEDPERELDRHGL